MILQFYIPGLDDETEEIKLPIIDKPIIITKQDCYHKWVPYTGLREVYHHCEHCGLKLDNEVNK